MIMVCLNPFLDSNTYTLSVLRVSSLPNAILLSVMTANMANECGLCEVSQSLFSEVVQEDKRMTFLTVSQMSWLLNYLKITLALVYFNSFSVVYLTSFKSPSCIVRT